jgi:hypothetical protein
MKTVWVLTDKYCMVRGVYATEYKAEFAKRELEVEDEDEGNTTNLYSVSEEEVQ